MTGHGRWDAVGTAMIGLLLVVIATILAAEMIPAGRRERRTRAHQAIEGALAGGGITSIIHLRTLHLGPEKLLVTAKIAVAPSASGEEVATAIDAAERRVRAAVPHRQDHLSRTRHAPHEEPR